ncbi:LOW QUALITY PROTEIN: hypothetical protein HID58_022094 [Brassica napus]|uniref:60S ribosomal protein L4 C-terminal domain-containing protein n=1 Tax=Brassica napus TaxID=3708 RepID=A0ABQ8CYI9_BRANA|nr:LOW QUALITY PROTEIN: hypothetical protein HID58_022094 [Brassica napus]
MDNSLLVFSVSSFSIDTSQPSFLTANNNSCLLNVPNSDTLSTMPLASVLIVVSSAKVLLRNRDLSSVPDFLSSPVNNNLTTLYGGGGGFTPSESQGFTSLAKVLKPLEILASSGAQPTLCLQRRRKLNDRLYMQSVVKPIKKDAKRAVMKKNPLKNLNVMLKLNPYAKTAKRMSFLAEAQRVKAKKEKLTKNRKTVTVRRLGRGASSVGILQRPNTDQNWYVALELQAFLDMAKDEGASRNFVMIASKTCVHIPESAFPKRERQSQWTVPVTELRESLRIAVTEVLLPAYRSFLKRFGFELKPDLCQKVSSFELDDSLVHCVLPRFEVEDGAVQREEVRRECGKGVTSSKALCGHMACHFEREKRVSSSHFFQVKKSVKSSVISHQSRTCVVITCAMLTY